jgi:hypothetical protein
MMIQKLTAELNVVDIFRYHCNENPVTFGDAYDKILTFSSDIGTNQCLDYIFEILYDTDNIDTNFEEKVFLINNIDMSGLLGD